jgi:hypothetical protein
LATAPGRLELGRPHTAAEHLTLSVQQLAETGHFCRPAGHDAVNTTVDANQEALQLDGLAQRSDRLSPGIALC